MPDFYRAGACLQAFFLALRACLIFAAFRAISVRRAGESEAARALPPRRAISVMVFGCIQASNDWAGGGNGFRVKVFFVRRAMPERADCRARK
jgi:hypothetical protein